MALAVGKDAAVEAFINELRGWRPTEAEGVLAQARIDRLDQTIEALDTRSQLYGRGIGTLRTLCRRVGRLPTSCLLEGDIHLDNRYAIHRTALSDVYQGRIGTTVVALKSLRLHGDDVANVEKSFVDEVVAWKCLRHPNIVPFLGISKILPVCLVSEWMAHGSVVSFLRDNPSEDRLKLASDVLNGLSYMHSHKIVHGDLKGANILVDSSRSARVADFGLTAMLQNTCTVTATSSARGTLRWMAPELLDGSLGPDVGGPTLASDIYAAGMVVWELFTGRIPFDDIKVDYRAMLKVLAGTRPERPVDGVGSVLTDKVWAILQDCWGASPEARPSCEVVVYRIGEPGIANVAPMSVKPELSPVYSSVDDHDAANGQGTPGIVHKMAVPDETQKQQAGTISSAGSQDDLLPTPEKQPVKPLELPKGQLASNVDSSSPKITRNSFSTHWLPSLFTRQKASSVMLTPSAPSGRQPARTPPPDALPTTSTGSASPASTLKRSFAASFIPSSLPSLFSVPLALPSTHTSPFAAPAFIPATGAPGFSGDRRWAKDEFKFDLAGELGGGEVGAAGVKRRALALVGKKEGAGVILSGVLADALRAHLPALPRLVPAWTLLYLLEQHGSLLSTLYTCTSSHSGPVLLAVRDAAGATFGVVVLGGLQMRRGSYYGGGESFLWKEGAPGTVDVFRWTGRNEYVALCEPDFISFGGGDGQYGLFLDEFLLDGSSAPCPTFANPPLCTSAPARAGAVPFKCLGLEVWGIGP